MPSTLYQSINLPLAPIASSILHLGGEYSAGVMVMPVPVGDNPILGVPVALLKSGNGSILDLTGAPGHPHTGGTGILGGEIMVNMPAQLGPAAVAISDGGILHVVAGGPPVVAFGNILRVANGSERRSSIVNVDPGIVATFSVGNLEAGAIGSVLEKTGAGALGILPGVLYASTTPGNTWGIKATAGTVTINQLPGIVAPTNGVAAFDGGTLSVAVPAFAIPAARQWSANNGFGGIESYAGTFSTLTVADTVMFRTTGRANQQPDGRVAGDDGSDQHLQSRSRRPPATMRAALDRSTSTVETCSLIPAELICSGRATARSR
jgi:hypothetical protein